MAMWAEPGNGLNMKTLWTDTPYAMQRVAGLFEAGEISAVERDDLSDQIMAAARMSVGLSDRAAE